MNIECETYWKSFTYFKSLPPPEFIWFRNTGGGDGGSSGWLLIEPLYKEVTHDYHVKLISAQLFLPTAPSRTSHDYKRIVIV